MYRAYQTLCCIKDKTTFLEKGIIHKEDLIRKNTDTRKKNDAFIFDNYPRKFKIKIVDTIPLNCHNIHPTAILTALDDENIVVSVSLNYFNTLLGLLNINKGKIEEHLIILNSSYKTIIAVEGTELFQTALISLERECVKTKEIQEGDIITFDSSYTNNPETSKGVLYLGSFLLSEIKKTKMGVFALRPVKYLSFLRRYSFDGIIKEEVIFLEKIRNVKVIGFQKLKDIDYSEMFNKGKLEIPEINLKVNLKNDSSFKKLNTYYIFGREEIDFPREAICLPEVKSHPYINI